MFHVIVPQYSYILYVPQYVPQISIGYYLYIFYVLCRWWTCELPFVGVLLPFVG